MPNAPGILSHASLLPGKDAPPPCHRPHIRRDRQQRSAATLSPTSIYTYKQQEGGGTKIIHQNWVSLAPTRAPKIAPASSLTSSTHYLWSAITRTTLQRIPPGPFESLRVMFGGGRCYQPLAKTLQTPSPPPATTSRPSALHATHVTPSPLICRCETISCVQMRFSKLQKRMQASCAAETASLGVPEGGSAKAEIEDGWASML